MDVCLLFLGCVMIGDIVWKLTIASHWCTLLSQAADGEVVEYVKC
jgi:hypothetical protein